jgi:hypothetical protein
MHDSVNDSLTGKLIMLKQTVDKEKGYLFDTPSDFYYINQ